MWNINGNYVQCIAQERAQGTLLFYIVYTCIRTTARGTDFNGVWRTTLSEVKDDLFSEEGDPRYSVNLIKHLDGGRRRGVE